MFKKLFALLLSAGMLLSLLAACGSPGADGPDSVNSDENDSEKVPQDLSDETSVVATGGEFRRQTAEGTLTVGVTSSVDGFDPTSTTNFAGLYLVYETLFYFDAETAELKNLLASAYHYKDDTHLEITLNENAVFSSGDPVTSSDVLWSWARNLEGSEASSFAWIDFEHCEIVNDHVFIIAMNDAFSPALSYMTMPQWSVVEQSAMENADADTWWSAPVGSGPYTVAENVSGSYTTYVRNENYWNQELLPDASSVKVMNYGSSATMFIDYQTGALDMVCGLDATNVDLIESDNIEATILKKINALDLYSVSLPEYTESLSDINVRKALAYALDTQAITDISFGSMGAVAHTVLPSGLDGALEVGVNEYNPDKAMELLEAAGYHENNPLKLHMVIVNGEIDERIAITIQEQWANVGVELTIDSCDLATAIPHFMNQETDLVLETEGSSATYNCYEYLQMSTASSTKAVVRFGEDEFNDAVKAGVTASDSDAAVDCFQQAQQWIADNCRFIPLSEYYYAICFRDYIADINTQPCDNLNLRWVTFANE